MSSHRADSSARPAFALSTISLALGAVAVIAIITLISLFAALPAWLASLISGSVMLALACVLLVASNRPHARRRASKGH
ncbi:MAG: hypothetical protein JWQ12_817 [Glaciihabitans sp.]|nr:hypothetical protein [Glaciihabitans sp.]